MFQTMVRITVFRLPYSTSSILHFRPSRNRPSVLPSSQGFSAHEKTFVAMAKINPMRVLRTPYPPNTNGLAQIAFTGSHSGQCRPRCFLIFGSIPRRSPSSTVQRPSRQPNFRVPPCEVNHIPCSSPSLLMQITFVSH